MATFTITSTRVTLNSGITYPCRAAVRRTRFVATVAGLVAAVTARGRVPACSGQRIPTGATVMQSTQIGRPHSEQESPVGRSGCR